MFTWDAQSRLSSQFDSSTNRLNWAIIGFQVTFQILGKHSSSSLVSLLKQKKKSELIMCLLSLANQFKRTRDALKRATRAQTILACSPEKAEQTKPETEMTFWRLLFSEVTVEREESALSLARSHIAEIWAREKERWGLILNWQAFNIIRKGRASI